MSPWLPLDKPDFLQFAGEGFHALAGGAVCDLDRRFKVASPKRHRQGFGRTGHGERDVDSAAHGIFWHRRHHATVEGFKEGKTAARSVPVVIAANKKLLQKAPEFVEFLKKYRTSSALTAEALAYIADNKVSYDEAAVHFLKEHSELLEKWLPADKAKCVRNALGN